MAKKVAGELYEGITGQLFEIGRQLRQPNGYPFDPEKLKRHLQDAIEGRFDQESVGKIYSVSVDYGMSVEELIKLGLYDWANSDITSKHFPTQRTGKQEVVIELIHFNRSIGSEEALRELDKMGYRPAELHELLAFGAKYPNIQREFPVIALGSVWQCPLGRRRVPFLYWGGSGRELRLRWFGDDWHVRCRFAAVRK